MVSEGPSGADVCGHMLLMCVLSTPCGDPMLQHQSDADAATTAAGRCRWRLLAP